MSERYINNLTGDFSICFSEHLTEHPTKLLNRDQLVYYADKIDEELQLEERSYLISQTLNSQSGLNYDQVRRTWQVISEVFRSATEERDL